MMDLSWDIDSTDITISKVYEIEETTSDYFMATNDFVSCSVQATDLVVRNGRRFLSTLVTATYQGQLAYELDTLLSQHSVNKQEFNDIFVDALGISGAESVTATLLPYQDTRIMDLESMNERTAADMGLIVATSCLAFLLVFVSTVLLYITGGWGACINKVMNCLFEEVEEDEDMDDYQMAKQATFQVQSYDEDTQGEATCNPNGVLGAEQNPAAGIINVHPSTPTSEMTGGQPLGITSMRKLPQEELHGLSSMIRVNQ